MYSSYMLFCNKQHFETKIKNRHLVNWTIKLSIWTRIEQSNLAVVYWQYVCKDVLEKNNRHCILSIYLEGISSGERCNSPAKQGQQFNPGTECKKSFPMGLSSEPFLGNQETRWYLWRLRITAALLLLCSKLPD